LRNQLAQFGYLQLLDFLTTVACLLHGIQESNPLVIALMRLAGSPGAGLAVSKLLAFGLAFYAWRKARIRLLWIINLFYSAVVVWNLVAMIRTHP
jgi:hypothetical protein